MLFSAAGLKCKITIPWLGTLHLGEFRATSAVLCEEKLIMEPVRVQVITIFVEKRNNSVRGNVAVIL